MSEITKYKELAGIKDGVSELVTAVKDGNVSAMTAMVYMKVLRDELKNAEKEISDEIDNAYHRGETSALGYEINKRHRATYYPNEKDTVWPALEAEIKEKKKQLQEHIDMCKIAREQNEDISGAETGEFFPMAAKKTTDYYVIRKK